MWGEAGLPHEVSQLNQLLSIPPPLPPLAGVQPGSIIQWGERLPLVTDQRPLNLKSQNHEKSKSRTFETSCMCVRKPNLYCHL